MRERKGEGARAGGRTGRCGGRRKEKESHERAGWRMDELQAKRTKRMGKERKKERKGREGK